MAWVAGLGASLSWSEANSNSVRSGKSSRMMRCRSRTAVSALLELRQGLALVLLQPGLVGPGRHRGRRGHLEKHGERFTRHFFDTI